MRGKNVKYVLVVVVLLALGFGVGRLSAAAPRAAGGTLDSPGPPGTTLSYTLADIYNRLNDGTEGTRGAFTEPGTGPTVGTGHTLDEVMAIAPAVDDTNGAVQADVLAGKTAWGLTSGEWGPITGTYGGPAYPGQVPKTGQTDCYKSASPWGTCTCGDVDCPSGQDGDLEKGVAWHSPRFITSTTGVVTDTLTGLVWLQNANCIPTHYPGFDADGLVTWQQALDFVAGINAGTYPNCGASLTDWRLPNVRELHSLEDYSQYDPVLPSGHPFTGVQSDGYWSSTTIAGGGNLVWYVSLYGGTVDGTTKSYVYYVWPVRGGQ
jgi:hypothetical protein